MAHEGQSMTESDLKPLRERGAAIRQAGGDFWSNPFFGDLAMRGNLEDFVASGLAWGDGWLREDAGRDEAMQRLLAVRLW